MQSETHSCILPFLNPNLYPTTRPSYSYQDVDIRSPAATASTYLTDVHSLTGPSVETNIDEASLSSESSPRVPESRLVAQYNRNGRYCSFVKQTSHVTFLCKRNICHYCFYLTVLHRHYCLLKKSTCVIFFFKKCRVQMQIL